MSSSTRRAVPTVLVVDDEPDLLDLVELTLVKMGLGADRATRVSEAIGKLQNGRYALCLTDMRLPDGTGLDVVRYVGEARPDIPVAVITAFGSTENAVEAMKAGAFDYLTKPVGLDALRALVRGALPTELPRVGDTAGLVGRSPAMEAVRELIAKLARTQAPVFVHGESGTGKELAARLIHTSGPRAAGPFVAVNCGAIPENLMESEFFGYRKGAFTGAETDRDGFFQTANGGTLFLDEVADLPLPMQVKLLRVIQEKKVRKIGSQTEEAVDVRIISATHQNLAGLVDAGKFRQDLFFRLHVIALAMPSLRDMPEDIVLIAEAILARLSPAAPPRLSPDAVKALTVYAFPGNVRELENILERTVALAGGDRIEPDDLRLTPATPPTPAEAGEKWPLEGYLDRVERDAIVEALEKTRFNKTAAARLLGITFRALRYRMERLGIE